MQYYLKGETFMTKNKNKIESLSKKLATYSLAAGGTLLMCTQANAAPQYSGVQNVQVTDTDFLDMDGNGVNDFAFRHADASGILNFFFKYQLGNSVLKGEIVNSNTNIPQKLSTGHQISPDNSFVEIPNYLAVYASGKNYGNFVGQNGFVGVKFKIDANTHYGWIHYEAPNPPTYGTIIDWGWESTPDTAILAGAPQYNKDPFTASVPTLNEWGILILMALILEESIRRMRREKETVRS